MKLGDIAAEVAKVGAQPDRVRIHSDRVPQIIEWIQLGLLPWKIVRDPDGGMVFDTTEDTREQP